MNDSYLENVAKRSLQESVDMMREHKSEFIKAMLQGVEEELRLMWEAVSVEIAAIGTEFIESDAFVAFLKEDDDRLSRSAASMGVMSYIASFDKAMAVRFSDRIGVRAIQHLEVARREHVLSLLLRALDRVEDVKTDTDVPIEISKQATKRPKLRRRKDSLE